MPNTRRTFVGNAALAISAAATLARAQSTSGSAAEELAKAIRARDLPTVKKLLDQDPLLVHARTADGLAPLHHATRAANSDIVLTVLSKGADLSAGPESPLLVAAEAKDAAAAYEMVAALAGNASNPNARDDQVRTALHRAAAAGHPLVCEFLIHLGTNPCTR